MMSFLIEMIHALIEMARDRISRINDPVYTFDGDPDDDRICSDSFYPVYFLAIFHIWLLAVALILGGLDNVIDSSITFIKEYGSRSSGSFPSNISKSLDDKLFKQIKSTNLQEEKASLWNFLEMLGLSYVIVIALSLLLSIVSTKILNHAQLFMSVMKRCLELLIVYGLYRSYDVIMSRNIPLHSIYEISYAIFTIVWLLFLMGIRLSLPYDTNAMANKLSRVPSGFHWYVIFAALSLTVILIVVELSRIAMTFTTSNSLCFLILAASVFCSEYLFFFAFTLLIQASAIWTHSDDKRFCSNGIFKCFTIVSRQLLEVITFVFVVMMIMFSSFILGGRDDRKMAEYLLRPNQAIAAPYWLALNFAFSCVPIIYIFFQPTVKKKLKEAFYMRNEDGWKLTCYVYVASLFTFMFLSIINMMIVWSPGAGKQTTYDVYVPVYEFILFYFLFLRLPLNVDIRPKNLDNAPTASLAINQNQRNVQFIKQGAIPKRAPNMCR